MGIKEIIKEIAQRIEDGGEQKEVTIYTQHIENIYTKNETIYSISFDILDDTIFRMLAEYKIKYGINIEIKVAYNMLMLTVRK